MPASHHPALPQRLLSNSDDAVLLRRRLLLAGTLLGLLGCSFYAAHRALTMPTHSGGAVGHLRKVARLLADTTPGSDCAGCHALAE